MGIFISMLQSQSLVMLGEGEAVRMLLYPETVLAHFAWPDTQQNI